MFVTRPVVKVIYNGKNITEDISRFLISVSYTDKVSGESDDIDIKLDDSDGLWANSWYPQKGSTISLEIGYDNGKMLPCGTFQIDDIDLSGPPDMITIKALSTGINHKLRTKRSYAHENKTLKDIINTVAEKYGFTVIGDIENIRIGRVTQNRESNLKFLSRLSAEYGYAFTVKGKSLVFTSVFSLEGRNKSLVIDKTDCVSYGFRDKLIQVYNKATARSHNPNSNKTINGTYQIDDSTGNFDLEDAETLDTLEVRTKTENEQQANAKSKAALHRANSLQQTATVTMPGNILAVSGNNIELTGFGNLSGIFHILSSTHSIDKSGGYLCSMEMKRILSYSKSGSKRRPKTIAKPNTNYNTK